MLNFSTSALIDADVLLYVTDVIESPDKNSDFLAKVSKLELPVLLLINKIDQTNQEKLIELVETWKELIPKAEIIPISALSKFHITSYNVCYTKLLRIIIQADLEVIT